MRGALTSPRAASTGGQQAACPQTGLTPASHPPSHRRLLAGSPYSVMGDPSNVTFKRTFADHVITEHRIVLLGQYPQKEKCDSGVWGPWSPMQVLGACP